MTLESLKTLLSENLSVNYQFFNTKTTILQIAFWAKKLKTFDFLLQNGAKFPPNFANEIWFSYMRFFIQKNIALNIKNLSQKRY